MNFSLFLFIYNNQLTNKNILLLFLRFSDIIILKLKKIIVCVLLLKFTFLKSIFNVNVKNFYFIKKNEF
jgi:hypothetical protein